jgi:hypothetical protein
VILSRVVQPGVELTVCGMPSKQWYEWLLTANVPLTVDMWLERFALEKQAEAVEDTHAELVLPGTES